MSKSTLAINLGFQGTEILTEADFPASASDANRQLTLNAGQVAETLNDSSTPAIRKPAAQINLVLGAGATVVDLAAVAVGIGRTQDMTGEQLVAFRINCPQSNTAGVAVEPAPTNGYPLFGTGGKITAPPGTDWGMGTTQVGSGFLAVSPTAKDIQISGTENDEINLLLWFGA